jgi:hypothetical protein
MYRPTFEAGYYEAHHPRVGRVILDETSTRRAPSNTAPPERANPRTRPNLKHRNGRTLTHYRVILAIIDRLGRAPGIEHAAGIPGPRDTATA